MILVDYLLLAFFWTGLILLLRQRTGLRDRAAAIYGRGKEKAMESGLVQRLRSLRSAGKKETMMRELADALSYTANLAVLGRGEKMSAELLMEELADISDVLAPVFQDMAHSLHINDRQNAGAALYRSMGEGYARDIGVFLAGWEDIAPGELASSIDAYRTQLRDMRETRQRRKDEIVSDLIYFPVVADAMLVLLNFIYVAYFIEQKEAMSAMFF